MTKIKALWAKIDAFLQKYSVYVHFILLAWNGFITSWGTGIVVPIDLTEVGIPYTIHLDARHTVSFIQAHIHIPTWVIGLATFAVNATVAYSAWKKSHIKVVEVPAGSVLIATPPDTLAAVEKKDDVQIKSE